MMNRIISIVLAAMVLLSLCAYPQSAKDMELYFSEDDTFALARPRGWEVGVRGYDNGREIAVYDPAGPSFVVVMSFTVQNDVRDAVQFSSAMLKSLAARNRDFRFDWVRATQDRLKAVVSYGYTNQATGAAKGRLYFMMNHPTITVFQCESSAADFERLQPFLLSIIANVTFVKPAAFQGCRVAASGAAAPVQFEMAKTVAKDGSCSMSAPRGWSVEGVKGQMLAASPAGDAGFAFAAADFWGTSRIPYFDSRSLPNVIHAEYMAPMDAMMAVLKQYGAKDIQVLWRAANPDKAKAAMAQSQGRGADAEVAILSYTTAKGARCRGYFDVLGSHPMNSGQWGIMYLGAWAPDAEFDRYVPALTEMAGSFEINQQWAQAYIRAGLENLRRLQRETAAKIARNAEEIRRSSNAAYQERMRSQDYIDYKRTGWIRGEQEWVSQAEGGAVYRSDAWGLSREGETVATGEPWNYYNYNGQNPRYNEQMTPVDASREVYESVYGR